ncbi:MAG: hypothetical protein LBU95_03540 [Rikenellaceae bacterium]|jgi:hypothetical protein|nr:hypothetical protein [Rikenellaceae bacterium]
MTSVPESGDIDLLTRQAVEMILQTQKAVENLAEQRTRHKLSSSRASAVAKELKQLRLVLADYRYQHSADRL